ncbi:MAG: hypothetical protein ACOYMD_15065 [Paludibacter sp.]|jgi:hypothetical protein
MKVQRFLLFLLILQCVLSTKAQTLSINGRWNAKLGFFSYPARNENSSITPTLRGEVNYGINKFIEIGPYLGVGMVDALIYYNEMSAYGETKFMPFYGINANFHILPFLVKKDDFRFDLYLAAKIGGHYCNIPEGNYPSSGNMAEYGIGLGFSFYLFNRLGLFTEYSYGQYDFFDESKYGYGEPVSPFALRYGLTMKFK